MQRFALALAALTFALPVHAQEFRASISGRVTDSSESIVPGATVVVTDIDRNTTSQTVSNVAGHYLVQFLLPGHYTVTAEKNGFKKYVHTGLTLEASDRIALDIAGGRKHLPKRDRDWRSAAAGDRDGYARRDGGESGSGKRAHQRAQPILDAVHIAWCH